MIELAPRRKRGFAIARPLIAATGSIGYGAEAARLITLERFGALVTAPLSLRPRKGNPPPRLVELPGGLLLAHGEPSPGFRRLHERHGDTWARSKTPYIAHLTGRTSLGELARRAEAAGCFGALEVDAVDEPSLDRLPAVRAASELPLLVRVPAGDPVLARQAAQAGADALVVISAPRGAAPDPHSGRIVEGYLYGPLVFPVAFEALRALAAAGMDLPLVACGGVHTAADVAACLAAGASAVMVDSLAWVDPAAVNNLLDHKFLADL